MKKNIFGKPALGRKLPPMHLICSTDDLRRHLQCIHIENGIATATNALALVRYNLTDYLEEDVLKIMDGKLIHKSMWELMCGVECFFIQAHENNVRVNLGHGYLTLKFVDEPYPDFHKITNPLFSGEALDSKTQISINTKQFSVISKVLNHASIIGDYTFFFNQDAKAIVIVNNHHDDGIAILAPVFTTQSVLIRTGRKFIK